MSSAGLSEQRASSAKASAAQREESGSTPLETCVASPLFLGLGSFPWSIQKGCVQCLLETESHSAREEEKEVLQNPGGYQDNNFTPGNSGHISGTFQSNTASFWLWLELVVQKHYPSSWRQAWSATLSLLWSQLAPAALGSSITSTKIAPN